MVKKSITLALVVVFALLATHVAYAVGAANQPVEWANNPGTFRASLTSLGQGWLVSGDRCDNNDYVMRINKNFSADPDRFRIYSYNSTVQNGFTNKSPMGYNLSGTSTSYLCLGFRDTWNGGGPLHVARNMFVWVK